jgi:hypothetical protein
MYVNARLIVPRGHASIHKSSLGHTSLILSLRVLGSRPRHSFYEKHVFDVRERYLCRKAVGKRRGSNLPTQIFKSTFTPPVPYCSTKHSTANASTARGGSDVARRRKRAIRYSGRMNRLCWTAKEVPKARRKIRILVAFRQSRREGAEITYGEAVAGV